MFYLYTFFIGAILGSFLNVVAFMKGTCQELCQRSKCDDCGQQLRWYDLVPILSYCTLKGKCRYCGDKIAINHIGVEIITGGTCCLLVHKSHFIMYMMIVSCLLLISIMDIDCGQVAVHWIVWLLLCCIIYRLYQGLSLNIITNCMGGVPMMVFNKIKKDSIGDGDIYIVSILGLLFTIKEVFVLLYGSSILGIIYYGVNRKKDNEIPFIPFLTTTTILLLTLK